jgi:hypothetical protein
MPPTANRNGEPKQAEKLALERFYEEPTAKSHRSLFSLFSLDVLRQLARGANRGRQ